jgi:hypothetical protein
MVSTGQNCHSAFTSVSANAKSLQLSVTVTQDTRRTSPAPTVLMLVRVDTDTVATVREAVVDVEPTVVTSVAEDADVHLTVTPRLAECMNTPYRHHLFAILTSFCRDTAKATGQGWGANTGDAEWSDEKTAEAIAQGEATGAGWDAADPATAEAEPAADGEPKEEAEPEEKVKTYEEYQQELKEKRAALNAPAQIRQPNEGSRDNKKWENATVLNKVEEDAYVAPKEGKAKAPKERKTKQLLEIEHSYQEPRSERGGRGGRGRGEGRGGRGRGEGRGGNRGDRAPRGGAPRAAGASVNLQDESAFPALA